MEITLPEGFSFNQSNNWVDESCNVLCDCGNTIYLHSIKEQYNEVLCRKCNLKYITNNNRDGSGLRFRIKGYFPFYPKGYKFIIKRGGIS